MLHRTDRVIATVMGRDYAGTVVALRHRKDEFLSWVQVTIELDHPVIRFGRKEKHIAVCVKEDGDPCAMTGFQDKLVKEA